MATRDALMASGFEVLGHSPALQLHWARRFVAYLLDSIVVLMPTWTVLRLLGPADPIFLVVASGVVFVLYGTAAEALHGKTLGKYVLGLEVRSLRGPLTVRKTAARNAPKFFWYVFPLLDVLLALVGQGDPRQRMSDRLAGTTVVWRDAKPAQVGRVTPRAKGAAKL
ncbi:MAG TPA: RDD family protein [Thermoplasmata archaeon]|jgi:hypothetical protein|nr:RDD family protein [Thermoplasmata archaeon]